MSSNIKYLLSIFIDVLVILLAMSVWLVHLFFDTACFEVKFQEIVCVYIAKMDPALLKERELFKKKALSTPS